MVMRYVELFAGGGGLSLGLDRAGWSCVAHAEIEPHARAVLRQQWPDTPLFGDVSAIDGSQWRGRVDVISGGSPCQDMSVAGKRAGLIGARSSLFHQQVRIWQESDAPYLLWENVAGAFSSNNGKDFAAVLSALVGAAIPVPSDGWERGGVAGGPTAVAAWRVLDLQHFGPPQRRVRVFVVAARTGAHDPAEILALSEGVCGHPSPREQARQGTAGGAGGGAEGGSIARTLDAGEWRGPNRNQIGNVVVATAFSLMPQNSGKDYTGRRVDVLQPITTGGTSPASNQGGDVIDATLVDGGRSHGAGGSYDNTPVVMAFTTTQTPKVGGDVLHTLEAASKSGGGQTPAVIAFEPRDFTRDNKNRIRAEHGRPRRLTPRECERLMGWPDDWTRYGVQEDGTRYELSDTARYRICGNGVGSPCAEWIARRFA